MNNSNRILSCNFKKSAHSEEASLVKPYKTLNLSELLDKKIPSPSQQIMKGRLLSQRSKRNQEPNKNEQNKQNPNNSHKRISLKINYQHYRSKSSSQIKNYYDSIKYPFQNQLDFVNSSGLKKSLVLSNSNSQILSSEVKGVSLENSYKSHQLVSKNSFKNQKYAFRQEVYAASKKKNESILVMSLEYKKNMDGDENPEYLTESSQKPNKKFLRKGSSLQKQIVINLLKNKIIKQHEENTKKQYTQHDILSMVKLYKGFLSFQNSPIKNPKVIARPKVNSNSRSNLTKQNSKIGNQEFLRTYQSLPERIVEKYPKPIVGWETSPQFYMDELKNEQQTEITMDHSYGLS